MSKNIQSNRGCAARSRALQMSGVFSTSSTTQIKQEPIDDDEVVRVKQEQIDEEEAVVKVHLSMRVSACAYVHACAQSVEAQLVVSIVCVMCDCLCCDDSRVACCCVCTG